MTIDRISDADIKDCTAIYNYYIENTRATLEETPLTEAEFAARVKRIAASYPYFAAKDGGEVIGYAYLDVFNARSAYRATADLSIYVRHDFTAKGVGRALLAALETAAKDRGTETLVSLITDENAGSIAFHERNGFVKRGTLPDVAYKLGKYVGLTYMTKRLTEKRSEETK